MLEPSPFLSHSSQVLEVEDPHPDLYLLVFTIFLMINLMTQCSVPSLDLGELQWELLALSSFIVKWQNCMFEHQRSPPAFLSGVAFVTILVFPRLTEAMAQKRTGVKYRSKCPQPPLPDESPGGSWVNNVAPSQFLSLAPCLQEPLAACRAELENQVIR